MARAAVLGLHDVEGIIVSMIQLLCRLYRHRIAILIKAAVVATALLIIQQLTLPLVQSLALLDFLGGEGDRFLVGAFL